MRKLLTSYEEDLIKNRVYISKVTRIFTYKDIYSGFGISKATLYRSVLPIYRELSRAYNTKEEEPVACYSCKEPLALHKRCKDCTVLLHSDNSFCKSCIDTRVRVMILV